MHCSLREMKWTGCDKFIALFIRNDAEQILDVVYIDADKCQHFMEEDLV